MAEEVIEPVDSTTDEGDASLDEFTPEPEEAPAVAEPQTEDIVKLKAELEAEKQRNKQLYARVKKQEIKAPIKEEETGDLGTRLSSLELLEKKRQFAWENSLSPEETDKVFALTAKPTKDTLDDPFVKAGLQAIRKLRRVNEATPSPSTSAGKINGKNWEDLDPAEQTKNYSEHVSQLLKKKR